MSNPLKTALQQMIGYQYSQIASENLLGYVSQVNDDGTAVAIVDGATYNFSPLYSVVMGQQVILMPDNAGNYSGVPTSPNPPVTKFDSAPLFTGGLFRFCGAPPGAGAHSPYEQYLPGYPSYTGVDLYVGAFQDAFNSNVYLLQDPTRTFGQGFDVAFNGTLSPNGQYYAINFLDTVGENIILQVWKIGATLGQSGVLNAAQGLYSLSATKVTEISIPYNYATEDLGQYPMYGRYLPDYIIAGPLFTYVVFGSTDPVVINQWVLCSNPSGDFPIAWLATDDPGPQYLLTPDNTYAGVNYKAVGVTLNTLLNSGEFCNSSDACNARGETYDVHGGFLGGLAQVVDVKVDDNGTIYWLQEKAYGASVVSDTPIIEPPLVPVNTVVNDATLAVSKGAGYYLYSQAIGKGQVQVGFWVSPGTSEPTNTSVTWNTPQNPFSDAGGLFFFVNSQTHVWWQPYKIFDYKTPSLLVKVPVNPASDPTFTGNYNWAILGPLTATILTTPVQFQSTNYNTGDIGTCTDSYPTETITPILQDSLSIPSGQGLSPYVDISEDFETVLTGNTTGTVTIIQQVPGTEPPVEIAVTNPATDFIGTEPDTTNIHTIFNKKGGDILDGKQHVYTAVVGPPVSFNTSNKLQVSPGQTDPTAIRIYEITGVAII